MSERVTPEKVITYLEMTGLDRLRPARLIEGVRLLPVADPSGDDLARLREVHDRIGSAHRWSSLAWSQQRWADWVADPVTEHWWVMTGETVAGWGCLRRHPERHVELDTFGLLPEYIGHEFGGHALTLLTRRAWHLPGPRDTVEAGPPVRRVWLRTSSWDHPHALRNYLARGFTPVTAHEAAAGRPGDGAGSRTPGE